MTRPLLGSTILHSWRFTMPTDVRCALALPGRSVEGGKIGVGSWCILLPSQMPQILRSIQVVHDSVFSLSLVEDFRNARGASLPTVLAANVEAGSHSLSSPDS